MYQFIKFTRDTDLTGYTLIIPSVSVGNVGQLTADLLITSFNLQRIATIWHPAIIPSAGGDPYYSETNEVCTACELYAGDDVKLAVVQIRSGLDFNKTVSFLRELKTALSSMKVQRVVILTTCFAHEMHNIRSGMFRYVTNQGNEEKLKELEVAEMETVFNGRYLIHGSGFAVKLYEILREDFGCTIIVKYTSEGDNRPDAVAMLELLKKLYALDYERIVLPSSWNFVFGNPPPVSMY